jgi:hypothetical protein
MLVDGHRILSVDWEASRLGARVLGEEPREGRRACHARRAV